MAKLPRFSKHITSLYLFRIAEVEKHLERLILTTPSGEERDRLTEINILFLKWSEVLE